MKLLIILSRCIETSYEKQSSRSQAVRGIADFAKVTGKHLR